jgi:hypothetical protein
MTKGLSRGLMACCMAVALLVCTAGAETRQSRIEALWGTRITIRELLRETCPEMLSKIRPQDYNVLVTWGKEEMVFRPIAEGSSKPDVEQVALFIYVNCTVSISANGRSVTYGASNTVIFPPFLRMPYMAVTASLREDGGIIDATSRYGYDVWRVTTNDTDYVAGDADYDAISYHYAIAPSGYEPPTQFTVRYSRTIHVD